METPDAFLVAEFIHDGDALLQELLRTIVWDERMRARKTASFGVPYNYSGIVYPQLAIPTTLVSVLALLNPRLGYESNNCLVNYYPDGKSKMGFHSDATSDLETRTGIAIVSLGSQRKLTFQNIADKAIQVAFDLPCGSLFFMTAETQLAWKHALLADPIAGARISLTFRRLK